MMDASLASSTLETREASSDVPASLIEACGLPEIGSRLAESSVRIDPDLRSPFSIRAGSIVLRPDVAQNFASAAVSLREAIELMALGGTDCQWHHRILAHTTATIYSNTSLRRRREAHGGESASDLAHDLGLDDVHNSPRETVEKIAHHLAKRDGLGRCPETSLALAASVLALALPTEVLLTAGGDLRQTVDWRLGVNSYGISPQPTPWKATFGSCTASAPTVRGFEAARHLRHRLIRAAEGGILASALELETNRMRDLIRAALGLANTDVDVVLTPSGTDAEIVALALSLSRGGPVRSVIIGPDEIGSGSVLAAQGRYFSPIVPAGGRVRVGSHMNGFAGAVEVIEVPIRGEDGSLLEPDVVESMIGHALEDTTDRLLLHVVEGSKTGVRLPRADSVARWEARFGARIDTVVDAAQMRVDQETVASHVQAGRMVFVTGSKFFGGPPFSGALLVPPSYRATAHSEAAGFDLSDYLTSIDVPDSLPGLKTNSGERINYGLLTRWEAALAEMRSFHNASPEIRDEIIRRLARRLRETLLTTQHVEIVESPYTPIPDDDHRGLNDLPTIFTFLVSTGRDTYLTVEQARAANALLGTDLSGDPEFADHPVAGRTFHLGQPVKISRHDSNWRGGLRIAIGAPTISQIVFDHTRGDHWTERIEREISDISDALTKLGLVIDRVAKPAMT